jgi:hypothetical protein
VNCFVNDTDECGCDARSIHGGGTVESLLVDSIGATILPGNHASRVDATLESWSHWSACKRIRLYSPSPDLRPAIRFYAGRELLSLCLVLLRKTLILRVRFSTP